MKKMILSAVLAATVLAPAAVAGKVYVKYNGSKESLEIGDVKQTQVCSFKQELADRYGLKMKQFDLKRSSTVLKEGVSLYDAGVRTNQNLHIVKRVTSSHQC